MLLRDLVRNAVIASIWVFFLKFGVFLSRLALVGSTRNQIDLQMSLNEAFWYINVNSANLINIGVWLVDLFFLFVFSSWRFVIWRLTDWLINTIAAVVHEHLAWIVVLLKLLSLENALLRRWELTSVPFVICQNPDSTGLLKKLNWQLIHLEILSCYLNPLIMGFIYIFTLSKKWSSPTLMILNIRQAHIIWRFELLIRQRMVDGWLNEFISLFNKF